jgi:hypothetical protein
VHRGFEPAKVLLRQRLPPKQRMSPMQIECSQDSFEFASLGSRKVTAAFDGGAITSNAGALLSRETDRRTGLLRQVAACFMDGRRQDKMEHSVATLVAHSWRRAGLRRPQRSR